MGRYAVLDSRAEKPELELSSSGASLTTSAVKTRIRSWTTGRIENRCEHVGVADDAAQAVENIGDAVLIDPELPDEVPDERQTMERMAYKYNAHIMPGTRNPARDAGHSKNNTGATAGKRLPSQPSSRTQTLGSNVGPPRAASWHAHDTIIDQKCTGDRVRDGLSPPAQVAAAADAGKYDLPVSYRDGDPSGAIPGGM